MSKIEISIALAMTALFVLLGTLSLAEDITVTADVSTYINVIANYSTVSFGSLVSPSSNNPAPNIASGIYNFTVDTNKNYKVEANATDFTGAGVIPNENLKLDTASSVGGLSVSNAVAMDDTPQLIDNNIDYTNTVNYHGWWLTIPSKQPSGSYSATATITISNVS